MNTGETGAQGLRELLRFPAQLLTAIFVFSLTVTGTFAQRGLPAGTHPGEAEQAAQMRALNNSLLQLHGEMQTASASAAHGIRSLAGPLIAQRAAALTKLIQTDPHTALTFAFSPELLADLRAKFPQSASLLESHTTVSGQLERWIEDSADLKTSRSYFFLKAGGRTLNLHFAGSEPTVKSGELLQATGVVVGSEMAVLTVQGVAQNGAAISSFWRSSNALLVEMNLLRLRQWLLLVLLACASVFAMPRLRAIRSARAQMRGILKQCAVCGLALVVLVCSPLSSSAQTCSTTGVQNVAVLLVTFPGYTNPLNPSDVYNTFFGTPGRSLAGYWGEASYGQTSATGNVFGVYMLTGSYSCSTMSQILNDAVAAASSAGVNFSNYSRIFVVLPNIFGCSWSGMSSVGCTTFSSPSGNLTASTTYLLTQYMNPGDQAVELVTHEGGHALGLLHSRSRDFSPDALGPMGVTGTLSEYGDYFSTMGWWNLGHYAAPHKAEVLNWLTPGTSYEIVQSSGTYTLQPYEQPSPGVEALKIQRGTGNNAWLWVEYRQPIGNYDVTLPTQPFGGAQIHYEDSVTGLHTDLLNFNPTNTTWLNTALLAGQSWTDPYSNVSISVLSATSSGLTVAVTYGAVPCTSSAPTVSVSPLNPSIYPAQTASYVVSVTNNDSPACSSSAFNLVSSAPSGWSTSLSSSSVTLSPGQSATITMGKGAPSATPAGTYAVNLSASSTTSSATGTANATVMTPPSLAVSISVSGSSFARPGTVPITASATNGGAPASGASVTFTLITPNGSISTQTATTSSNGTATWNYKLSSKSPAGTYSVSAQAALSSGSGGKKTSTSTSTQTVSSNTATFSVQ